MNRSSPPRRHRRITRQQAAAMLREARRPGNPNASELICWAHAVMPDRKAACALKVDDLLRCGQYDSADAILARCLMQSADDHPLMRLRYARSLHGQGRIKQAAIEIERVLHARPEHCGALRLAAQIATDLGDHRKALAMLDRALALRPEDRDLLAQRVQTLLHLHEVQLAAEALSRMAAPPPVLRARVLRAQRRLLDAAETLRFAQASAAPAAEADHIASELIDVLEVIGDSRGIDALAKTMTPHQAEAAVRACRALLAQGTFAEAQRLLGELHRRSEHRRAALHLIAAIPASQGKTNEASQALEELAATAEGIDAAALADAWLRVMFGQLLREQVDAKQACCDPSTSQLQPLLREALATFDAELEAIQSAPSEAAGRKALQRHRAMCLLALGRSREAAQVLADTDEPVESTTRPHSHDTSAQPQRVHRRAA